MMAVLEFIVSEELSGTRLDVGLVALTELKRADIQKWIKEGHVRVDGRGVKKPSFTLTKGMALEMDPIPAEEEETFELSPEAVALDIVYEDDAIIVVNKPRGMVVYPTPQHQHGTLVQGLLYLGKPLSYLAGEYRPGIVHRIDKDTSGLLVIAKTDEAYEKLVEGFAKHQFSRHYYALVVGVPELPKAKIHLPIGRDPNYRTRFKVVESGGKEAITHYEVLRFAEGHALVDCVLETGRTHQIRVHLAHIGTPIYGDALYGKGEDRIVQGQALHAYCLELEHPLTAEKMVFHAPIPDDFQAACQYFNIGLDEGEGAIDQR